MVIDAPVCVPCRHKCNKGLFPAVTIATRDGVRCGHGCAKHTWVARCARIFVARIRTTRMAQEGAPWFRTRWAGFPECTISTHLGGPLRPDLGGPHEHDVLAQAALRRGLWILRRRRRGRLPAAVARRPLAASAAGRAVVAASCDDSNISQCLHAASCAMGPATLNQSPMILRMRSENLAALGFVSCSFCDATDAWVQPI